MDTVLHMATCAREHYQNSDASSDRIIPQPIACIRPTGLGTPNILRLALMYNALLATSLTLPLVSQGVGGLIR